MLRSSNPTSSMQKTYDDCYLICSTAIYFEKQNNEEEALRSWRDALDQIYYHNAYRIPANYRPKTETERALQDSLRDMELQCKERVDLLDALHQSRTEVEGKSEDAFSANGKHLHQYNTSKSKSAAANKPGQGTVPTANYPEIAKPALPSRFKPSKPSLFSNRSSNNSATFTQPSSFLQISSKNASSTSLNKIAPPTPPPTTKHRPLSRSPSPSKKDSGARLKSTLRSKPKEEKRGMSARAGIAPSPRPVAAATAASLAWPAGQPPQSSFTANGTSPRLGRPALMSNGSMPPPSSTLYGNAVAQSRKYSEGLIRQPSVPESQPRKSEPTLRIGPRAEALSQRQSWAENGPSFNQHASLQLASSGGRDRSLLSASPHQPADNLIDLAEPLANNRAVLQTPPPAPDFPAYRKEYPKPEPLDPRKVQSISVSHLKSHTGQEELRANGLNEAQRKPRPPVPRKAVPGHPGSPSKDANIVLPGPYVPKTRPEQPLLAELSADDQESAPSEAAAWDARVAYLMKNLPRGVDEGAAKAIFNEIVIKGDEVHWEDVAGLDIAKNALKEAVVYPFLRPDLFLGLREPARGMLLFGPPGTGKTMLARAVATESRSTFFAISASSLTSKFLGESEKLVRALFTIAKALAPSIIFVDEIDSLLSARSGSGEHEATRRIKTEFLIQWSDLQKAAAGREQSDKEKAMGDATRVLVLAATNLPWAIDEAARRRFVRRQYIPLPEDHVRVEQLKRLMSAQKHNMTDVDFEKLVALTDGFSGSDITALAKDAAMGPLRSLGERLLHMSPDQIRPIMMEDFEASLVNIRPSVSKQGLKEFEDWARDFGERGG